MPFTFTMPKLSPTMQEGVIAKWHKKEGDYVEAGDLLLEVSTDKATVEHNAIDPGFLRKMVKKEGDKAAVNEPLAILTEKENESIEGYEPEGAAPVVKATPQPQKIEPSKQPSSVQEKPQLKASPQKSESHVEKKVAASKTTPTEEKRSERILASPLARALAEQEGLDLSKVSGSGPHGRIMSRDLAQAPAKESAPTTCMSTRQGDREEAMTPMRRVIADRLQYSKQTIPHFYIHQLTVVDNLVKMREEAKRLEKNLTVNDFIIKAVATALKLHPHVNSGYDEENNCIIRYGNVDLSIAVTIQGGLITPIVKSADTLSLTAISQTVKSLAAKAKEGRLKPEEYMGGSFTISNLGMFGVTDFQAIVNPPQAAILAIGAIQDAPVVRDGNVVAGKTLSVVLSCDHRVIDGSDAAQFMQTLKKLIENPLLFLTD